MTGLFDPDLRTMRRDRAARTGPALFLHQRTFDDILDRLHLLNRRFDSAMLVGCPDPEWVDRLGTVAEQVRASDPSPRFATALGTSAEREDALDVEPGSLDLIVAIGTLDTLDDLPGALLRLALALRPGGLLIGAIAGGDTLPALRAAMHAADKVSPGAQAHIHPRIEPSALAPLLEKVGLVRPVIDIDRIKVSYSSLRQLIADLRAMGSTNILRARPRSPILRNGLRAAERNFSAAAVAGKTVETFEIVHFAAWAAPNTGGYSQRH